MGKAATMDWPGKPKPSGKNGKRSVCRVCEGKGTRYHEIERETSTCMACGGTGEERESWQAKGTSSAG